MSFGAVAVLVVMGVCGSGKSTVGKRIAAELGWAFVEGDAHHPATNVAKMAAGVPLTDDDRRPWLEALADEIRLHSDSNESTVLACSALRRAYRDVLRSAGSTVFFVHLHGDRAVLLKRLTSRMGHFLPPSLLDSQLLALEPPKLTSESRCLTLDVTLPPDLLVHQTVHWLHQERALQTETCEASAPTPLTD